MCQLSFTTDLKTILLTLQAPISQNGQTRLNNSSANCLYLQRIGNHCKTKKSKDNYSF